MPVEKGQDTVAERLASLHTCASGPITSPVHRLLSCLKSLGAAGLAVSVFDWLDSHGYPTRDAYVLTRLMSMLPAPRALALFDRLTGAGLKPDLASFNAAISTAGAWRAAPGTATNMWARVPTVYPPGQVPVGFIFY